jgi:ABC-2 type transport system permease protein/oleandomycin transport system permease protein
MTAVAQTPPAPRSGRAPQAAGGPRIVADSWMMAWRLLKATPRQPELFMFSTIQTIMFVLLFRYVFGGAINTGGIPYVQFLMPGIFVQTLAFNGAVTGIGMADDLAKGIVDRFRSMPISPVALFVGRAISDLVRATLMLIMMIAVGMATGFRFHSSAVHVIAGLALILLFSFAFSWIGIWIGLIVKTVEAAQSGGFIWLFPLTFASAAFVPVERMPGWLQAFAKYNPITLMVDALRGWFDDGVRESLHIHATVNGLQSLAWIAGVLIVFVPLCVSRYRRLSG